MAKKQVTICFDILSQSWLVGAIFYILIPAAIFEDTGPSYDTGDWIPIVPDTKPTNRESKSSDRILNVGLVDEKYIGEEKLPVKKILIPHKHRKNPHMKRSPNQRPRIKLEQPYRFENILSPPPKQLRGFPQKNPYQQSFNPQHNLQYNFNIPLSSHIANQEAYQQFPVPSNPSVYNLNHLQAGPGIPNYSQQLGFQYQQQSPIQQIPSNNTVFQHPAPVPINQGLFETTGSQQSNQNPKIPAQEEKDTVQLLYVPLDQLQKQQGIDSGILDEAFKSLQQQRLVAAPQDLELKQTEQRPQQSTQQNFEQNDVNQQKYSIQQNQPNAGEEKREQQQYYVLQNTPLQKQPEAPRYYELVSKNRGQLVLQNNPKTVEVSSNQGYQVSAERQKIVELTTPQSLLNHQLQYNTPFEHQEQQKHQLKETRIEDQRDNIKKAPQIDQSFVVQNQISQPFSVEAQKLQQSYIVRNQPQTNQFKDQKSRLESIQKDILQQTLQVEKLQNQIQQGKSLEFQGKNTPTKKRKPHQPPLAVYMEGNKPGDVEAVLELLKNAKSIAVQDQIGPNTPQVFIGPSNLNVPNGFAKFPLPYLSNLDNNRIQRKAQQFPFFVAPINYKEPEGYSKIPLPSPHVGSVVVSQLNQKQIPNSNDNFQESNRPVAITNYKFVNPAFESIVDNTNFDQNLNAYSLESGNPRDNSNRHLKEQTLYQQINGFSGFEFPQNQYFPETRPSGFGQEQLQQTVSPTPQTINDQYLEEVHREPALTSPEVHRETTEAVPVPPIRQRGRGEKIRGSKKGSPSVKLSSNIENSEKSTQATITQKSNIPEVPTPNIIHAPERVEISSQNPLTQDFLNRFSSNNNFNFNYVSSTHGYEIPPSTVEELPANIRKLNPVTTQDIEAIRNQQAIDAQFEQSIQNLQNSKEKVASPQEERKVHVYNQYEQYEIPPQLTDINPNLPGLINELEQQNRYTSPKYETRPPSTTASTPQYTVKTTEATTTTTTTRKPRGRGRSRFNMRTTTPSTYRRTSGERRRPIKTTTTPTTEAYENPVQTNEYSQIQGERTRPRTRLQNTLTERLAEGSIESTSSAEQLSQPITRVMDISQNQPNYFVEFQSSVANVRPVLRDYVEEPKTETVRVAEQYQSQKVTTAQELALQKQEQTLLRQIPVIQPERSEPPKPEPVQSSIENTTRRRIRVRGRPKNKYSSTTIAPRTTTEAEKEENEFYGFIRQPNFSQSSQISNSNRNEEDNIHIYAPTQQKSPVYTQRNYEPVGPSSPRSDPEAPKFIGELRPKYASPSRGTTTQQPEITSKGRVRGRVRIPGRTYENKVKTDSSSERTVRGRTRGRTHFTPPRNVRQETENGETENYPAPFLKSRVTSTTPSSSEFKITVSTDDEVPDEKHELEQPHNYPNTQDSKNIVYGDEVGDENEERGRFGVVGSDNFDTAESQNYRSLINSLDSPYKVNNLESEEKLMEDVVNTLKPEETTTVTVKYSTEDAEITTTTEIPYTQGTSIDDLNSTILESVRESIGNSTTPFFPTTTTDATLATTTGEFMKEPQNSSKEESTESITLTSTINPEEAKTIPAETKMPEQTPLDLLLLQTSTSTEVSHETEICYKGRCVKSRNKKFRKRLIRKKSNETNI